MGPLQQEQQEPSSRPQEEQRSWWRKILGDDVAHNVEPILEEALDNLREATQRLRAIQNRMLAADMQDQPNYWHLFVQVSTALAITEASIVEARRMLGK
jgi:formate dehydrogenase maturation protein FdhE